MSSGMGLRGDFQKLRDGISRIRKLGNVGPELWQRMAPHIESYVQKQFAVGVTPYLAKWKPLAKSTVARGRSAPPLTDTGEMAASLVVENSGNTLMVQMTDPVAGLHQWGWRKKLAKPKEQRKGGKVVAMRTHGIGGPKRQILPDGRVPNEWRRAIRKMARIIMAERLGRAPTRSEMG